VPTQKAITHKGATQSIVINFILKQFLSGQSVTCRMIPGAKNSILQLSSQSCAYCKLLSSGLENALRTEPFVSAALRCGCDFGCSCFQNTALAYCTVIPLKLLRLASCGLLKFDNMKHMLVEGALRVISYCFVEHLPTSTIVVVPTFRKSGWGTGLDCIQLSMTNVRFHFRKSRLDRNFAELLNTGTVVLRHFCTGSHCEIGVVHDVSNFAWETVNENKHWCI
jgi:hypothetical protein